MITSEIFEPGNYRYLPGVFQYSAGVAAQPGYEIVHVTLTRMLPMADGFEFVHEFLASLSLPLTAFCACELRSGAPFTEAGFEAFNKLYVGTLSKWGIVRDGINPVARSNVCPEVAPPSAPALYAFGFVRPATDSVPTAIVAGSGEVLEGKENYRDHIVAPGDTSHDGMRRKAKYVTNEMTRRLGALGFSPTAVTVAQVYTVEPIHGLLETQLLPSGLLDHGLTWHYARPPIVGLSFEMDVRCVTRELSADSGNTLSP
ncbi:MAG: hypothetical protein WBD34_20790 [Burkholderiaceae bacterium]